VNGPLGHSGRWLTDGQGRVVILHGVNLVNKRPPYEPGALGFDREHAAHLAREGFNSVRLCMIWKALEPEPGGYDDNYLDRIADLASLIGGVGLHVLLDFHQDMWNERFGGEGAPDWAVRDGRLPAVPNLGFPANYAMLPALWRAYDDLWANRAGPGGIGLQDRFAAAWRHVAQRFRDVPYVFGYDILNEPFPGSALLGSVVPGGARRFERKLSVFHRRVIRAIRQVDAQALVFYEPGVLLGFGVDVGDGGGGDPNAGLSFHSYCAAALPGAPKLPRRLQQPFCTRQAQMTFDRAERHSRRHGVALLLTEFGATDDPLALLRGVETADSNLASWHYWAYWNRDVVAERPEEGIVHDLSRPPTRDNVKQEKLDVLVRPYPRALAGTPLRIAFDRPSREFDLSYTTRAPNGEPAPAEAHTEVLVPVRHYPRGYVVEVDGARMASRPGAPILELVAEPGQGRVRVRVRPKQS
jgi:endoglycosylceramidase